MGTISPTYQLCIDEFITGVILLDHKCKQNENTNKEKKSFDISDNCKFYNLYLCTDNFLFHNDADDVDNGFDVVDVMMMVTKNVYVIMMWKIFLWLFCFVCYDATRL